MRWMVLALTVTACGGGSRFPTKPYGYFDPSPSVSTIEESIAGVGLLCDKGSDCAGGLACSNLLSAEVTECEMPTSGPQYCPSGLLPILAAAASPGGPLQEKGWFCMRACRTGAECRNGQCCLGFTNETAPWCVYDYPPRWTTTPLLCGP